MMHEPFGPHGAEEETEELWTDLSEVPETAYEQDPKRRINSDTDMPFDPSLLPAHILDCCKSSQSDTTAQPSRRGALINPRVGAGGYCYRVVFTANGQRMERHTNDSFWFHHDGQQGKTVLVWYNPASPVVERKSRETEVLAAAMGVLATALLLIH